MKDEDMVDEILQPFSPFLSGSDLIKLGVFMNTQSTYRARKGGKGPKWLYVPGRGYVYPKQGVAEFLKERLRTREKDPIRMERAQSNVVDAHYAT